jgi:phage anti-repressor protein
MENFLYKFSSIPKKFIKDFYVIAKEEYLESEKSIDFDVICEWLETRKDHLKVILEKNFEKEYDYEIERKSKSTGNGSTRYDEIMITSNCFKELCMISQTAKAKEVRKYFIEMEKIVRMYHERIRESMYKQIGILKKNQKPKINVKSGVLYVIKAQNNEINESLYKIGKTKDIVRRIKEHNSGVIANDEEVEFIIPVKDIDTAERCLKGSIKVFQYRKYKEIYEIDIKVLRDVMSKCKDVADGITKVYEKNNKKVKSGIKEMNKGGKYYMIIKKEDEKKSKVK